MFAAGCRAHLTREGNLTGTAGAIANRVIKVGRDNCRHDSQIESRILHTETACKVEEYILFNPERIVIGSVFARSEALFREEMEKVIAQEALAEAAAVCTVVPAALGDAIGDCAAVAVAQRGWEENHV